MIGLFFAPDGSEITSEEWARLSTSRWEDISVPESWWRKLTHIGDVSVSTVWIGLNHQFGEGPPLIWETMILGGEHDGQQWRYPSRASALDDHERILAALRSCLDPADLVRARER